MFRSAVRALALVAAVMSLRATSPACACGCNVFTVGNRWSMPTSAGFAASLQYNYMNQYRNWGAWRSAPADANEDMEIRTSFYTLGVLYSFDRDWGVRSEFPVWNRYFRTTNEDGEPESATHTSFGDVRILGMYTGLAEDLSTGFQFGVKLPTGSFRESLLDRDTQIGTGTTDLLLGGYHMEQYDGWGWYAQAMYQYAVNTRDGYRPGDSFDVTAGAHYDGLVRSFRIVPILQLAGSYRGVDGGENSEPENTGYARLFVAPAVEVIASNQFTLYGEVRIPLTTHVRGIQLVAPSLVSITMSYSAF